MSTNSTIRNNLRILVMGLPGSGKTTFARQLNLELPNSTLFNADVIREKANDWDFSEAGRIRQAHRMRNLVENSPSPCVILDFVCGLSIQRDIIRPHVLIWMNTIKEGRYEDTNKAFTEPAICALRFDSFDEVSVERAIEAVKRSCFHRCSHNGNCTTI